MNKQELYQWFWQRFYDGLRIRADFNHRTMKEQLKIERDAWESAAPKHEITAVYYDEVLDNEN